MQQQVVRRAISLSLDDPKASVPDLVDFLVNLSSSNQDAREIERLQKKLDEFLKKKQLIITRLRELAVKLSKVNIDTRIADGVGRGAGIAGGFLMMAGLVAAPVTAGGSLLLSGSGLVAEGAGLLTSIGSNTANWIIFRTELTKIQQELKELIDLDTELMANTNFLEALARVSRLSPSLEKLEKMFEKGSASFFDLLTQVITLAVKGEFEQIHKLFDTADASCLKLLKQLPLSRENIHDLARILSQFQDHGQNIKNVLRAWKTIQSQPHLSSLAMRFTSNNANMKIADKSAVTAAFRGTPLAMSASARLFAGAVISVSVAVGIFSLVKLVQDNKEHEAVIKLRELADSLENEDQT